MDDQRSGEPGRREDDLRWLEVQKQLMNLVTTQVTNQNEIAKLDIAVGELADHVDEVDEHLRGVGGKESVDTRVTVMEKDVFQHGVLLRRISDMADQRDVGRAERFKEWLKFWGPIIIATLALVGPKVTFNNWNKLTSFLRNDEYRPDERLRKQIEADKKGQRGKAVKKKLAELERAAEIYQP